ncbi:hypothetical protein [Streptosporangium sp. NPDC002607]
MADTVPANESGGPEDLEQAAVIFAGLRPRLFGIAYRMLGSVTEAGGRLNDPVALPKPSTDTDHNGAAFKPIHTAQVTVSGGSGRPLG